MSAAAEIEVIIANTLQAFIDSNVGVAIVHSDKETAIHRLLNSRQHRELIRRFLAPVPGGLKMWDEEPHLRYRFLREEQPPTVVVPAESGDLFMRLAMGAPSHPYSRCPPSIKCLASTVHVGQRKLLISEVQFMTMHGSKSIGAAGGQHTPALCELFPSHRFLLYDPAPFSKPLLEYMRKNPKRVAVYNELFPPHDKTGRAHRDLIEATSGDNGFLLISDIRRRDAESEAPTNKDVAEDMDLQSDICREMQPKAAHLKCRLPYFNPEGSDPDIEVSIPKGVIYFQPWCGHKSTETRLIIEPPFSDDNMMTISARWYESALYYHNMNTRFSRFSVPVLAPLDLFVGTVYDTCFDCTYERYTLMQYITSNRGWSSYTSLADIYNLFKRVVGREDERLLQEPVRRG